MKSTGLTAKTEIAPVIETEGDIFKLLRAIQARYLRRAEYLSALNARPHGDGMYYENAAAAVGLLIPGNTEPTLEVQFALSPQ